MRSWRTLTVAGTSVLSAMVAFSAIGVSDRNMAARAATAAPLGPPPVVFEPNVGQTAGQVRFVARAGRARLALSRSRLVLTLGRDVVAFRFTGGNPERLVSEGRLPGASNYLIGSDPHLWRTHIPQFRQVRYRQLYRGVDLVVHGRTDARLEYDFQLAPRADPRRIRLAIEGPRSLRIAPDGALVIHLRHGDIRQPRPLAWQSGKPVSVAYRLHGNTVGFRLGRYDRLRPVLIDPKVLYATYLGGSGAEGCVPVTGSGGSVYLICGTDSSLPQVHSIQGPAGGEDVYVAKLDSNGRLVYATYLGGPGMDEGDTGAVDEVGHLFIGGFAGPGFPTTPGAFDPSFNGDGGCCGGFLGDGFVAKLSSDGARLIYSTYLGGSSGERVGASAVQPDGSLTVSGFTGSADFPMSRALDAQFGGGSGTFEGFPVDGYGARLDPTGSHLVYSTYLGGAGDDTGSDVAVDGGGNAYYTGTTQSADFPTTAGAVQPSLAPGAPGQDAYVTKLDHRGRLVWSTYLGGDLRDRGSSIDVGLRGNVFLSGSTRGDFPVTPGATQAVFGGGRDWFVARLDRSGSSIDWATYFGGSDLDGDIDTGLRVDSHGRADVIGMTASTDFPTTPDALQSVNAGVVDVAIAQFDRDGRLRFASYLGGSGVDDTTGGFPALDRHGHLYFGGITTSADFPVTPDAIQAAYGGGDVDAFVVKVDLDRHEDDD